MRALTTTIAGQGDRLREVLAIPLETAASTIQPARRVWLVGTGTSQHAAELGAWMFAGAGRAATAVSAASFVYQAPRLADDDAVVVISHTTETAYAQTVRAAAIAAGAGVVTITGRGGAWAEAVETVDREASETYTVSYTATLVVLARLAMALGDPGFGAQDLSELPDRVQAAASESPLEDPDQHVVALAGIGPGAITAREGALKLREAARVIAEGYEAEYLLHGCAVPLTRGDVLLALEPPEDPSGLLPQLVQAAGAEGLRTRFVREPAGLHPLLAQIPLTARLQSLAAQLAQARGVDPDLVIVGAWARPELWVAGGPVD